MKASDASGIPLGLPEDADSAFLAFFGLLVQIARTIRFTPSKMPDAIPHPII
jgi:hypothetical protein